MIHDFKQTYAQSSKDSVIYKFSDLFIIGSFVARRYILSNFAYLIFTTFTKKSHRHGQNMETPQITFFVFYCLLCVATWTQVTMGNPVDKDQVSNTDGSETTENEFHLDTDHECQLNNASSCPPEHCCVKEILIYQPSFKGQKTANLVCRRMRDDGELCILKDTLHICPCREGLECVEQEETDYGHCTRL